MRLVLLLALAWGGVAWGGERVSRTIVTTFYPVHIAVLNIVADVDGVRAVNLAAPAAGCLHDYHLTTRDFAVLAGADAVVANGAGIESFRGILTRRWPKTPVIDASAGLDLLVESGRTNAHVWVSPARHMRQVRTIAEGLAVWDPDHAGAYRRNAANYIRKLEALKIRMDAALKDCPVKEIITFHEAFAYFAADFNLSVVGVVEREPGAEPSAGELAELIRKIRTSRVKALFVEPQYPAQPAMTLVRETGIKPYRLDPVVSGPLDPDAYLDIMDLNLAELKRALAR